VVVTLLLQYVKVETGTIIFTSTLKLIRNFFVADEPAQVPEGFEENVLMARHQLKLTFCSSDDVKSFLCRYDEISERESGVQAGEAEAALQAVLQRNREAQRLIEELTVDNVDTVASWFAANPIFCKRQAMRYGGVEGPPPLGAFVVAALESNPDLAPAVTMLANQVECLRPCLTSSDLKKSCERRADDERGMAVVRMLPKGADDLKAISDAARGDVERLKFLLGGRNASLISIRQRIGGADLVQSWPRGEGIFHPILPVSLLEIAAGNGAFDCASFLIHFCNVDVTREAVRQACRCGDQTMVRFLTSFPPFDAGLDQELVRKCLIAASAAESLPVMKWLLDQRIAPLDSFVDFALSCAVPEPWKVLVEVGFSLCKCSTRQARLLQMRPELLEVIHLARCEVWAESVLPIAESTPPLTEPPPGPPKFARLVRALLSGQEGSCATTSFRY
jgi:hypothetical protein